MKPPVARSDVAAGGFDAIGYCNIYTPRHGDYDAMVMKRFLPVYAVTTVLLTSAGPLLAQDVGTAPAANAWMPWVVAGLLTIVILMVSLMPSKRDHRD